MKIKKQPKEEILARLTITGLPEMDTVNIRWFKKWIKALSVEFIKFDKKAYNKNFRATLYKIK